MTQSSPLFSICVPQYERTDHFIAALGTFAAQRFRDFEVVVSDGGSRDGGIEYARLGSSCLPRARHPFGRALGHRLHRDTYPGALVRCGDTVALRVGEASAMSARASYPRPQARVGRRAMAG